MRERERERERALERKEMTSLTEQSLIFTFHVLVQLFVRKIRFVFYYNLLDNIMKQTRKLQKKVLQKFG